jgi:hypothetical protein
MSSLDFDFDTRSNDASPVRAAQTEQLIDRCIDAEAGADILERRWFAAMAAVESLKDDCRVRLRIISLAEEAWRRDSVQLAQLEALRDALADKLAALQGAVAV